ncbi:MAG: DNA repair protein RadA [Agarilytica sp.]
MATVIYIHGFLSSPLSKKAQVTKAWLAENYSKVRYLCPQLSSYPSEAKAQLESTIKGCEGEKVFAIGSSLGGYWATHFVEAGLIEKAVLVNPAVSPASRFPEFIDVDLKSYYSDTVYRLSQSDVENFKEFDCEKLQAPEKYWLLVQTEDETLDYRLAVEKYKACEQTVEDGGNHSFEGYDRFLQGIAEFFELKP